MSMTELLRVTESDKQKLDNVFNGWISRIKVGLAVKKKINEFEGILDTGKYFILIDCNNLNARQAYYLAYDKMIELEHYIGKCVDIEVKSIKYTRKCLAVFSFIKEDTGKIKVDLGK